MDDFTKLYDILSSDDKKNMIIIEKNGILKYSIPYLTHSEFLGVKKILYINDSNRYYYRKEKEDELSDYISIDLKKFIETYPEFKRDFSLKKREEFETYFNNYYKKFLCVNYDAAYITDNIIIGCGISTYNIDKFYNFINTEKIDVIINISDEQIEIYKYIDKKKIENIQIFHCPINENKYELKELYNAVEILHNSILENKKVYVHCYAGYNRSPSVVLFYFVKYLKNSLFDAYKKIRSKRDCCINQKLVKEIYNNCNNKDIIIYKISCDLIQVQNVCYSWNICGFELL